jgi:Holliday junction resolvasome RuvABC endonuclease subunit
VDFLKKTHALYHPAAYFLELPHSGAKSAAAIKGMAFATAYLVAALRLLTDGHVPIVFFLPYAIKKYVAGNTKASKLEVAQAVIDFWPEVAEWPGYAVVQVVKKRGNERLVVQDKALSHDATDAGAVCITAMTTSEYGAFWETDNGRATEHSSRAGQADRTSWSEF